MRRMQITRIPFWMQHMTFNAYYVRTYLRLKICWLAISIMAMSMSASSNAETTSYVSTDIVDKSVSVSNKQNLNLIKEKIAEFLQTQTIGYPGKVKSQVGAIDPNLKLAKCHDLLIFMPGGSRAWGKTTVGAKCEAPSAWTIYVQVNVNVLAEYLVAAAPLGQGQIVTAQDVIFENGDLTQLPAGVFTDATQAIGRSVNISMNAGTVLRQEMLKITPVVQQGQTVKLVSSGAGFSVSAEGKAMGKANEGQVVQVKVASGQIVTGIAHAGGQIEVGF
jgi:flagellar basal body P-ring formation protein FlgA